MSKKEFNIIENFADFYTVSIAKTVVIKLKRLKDCLLSEEESGLENIWEEFCVQIQGEESIFWSAYISTVEVIIYSEMEKTPPPTISAINYVGFFLENGGDDDNYNYDYDCDILDISNYYGMVQIKNELMDTATNYNNKKIDKYLYGGWSD